jgi:selenocysteine-specific elongation factor
VADPQPKGRHRRFDEGILRGLESLAEGSPADVLLQASLALGLAPAKEVVGRSRLEVPQAAAALEELLASRQLAVLDDEPATVEGSALVMAASQWSALRETVTAILAAYHQSYPLRHGMPREELKSRLRLPPRLFNAVLRRLAQDGALTEGPKWAALPGHRVRFSPFQQVKVDKLMALFAAAPYLPPSVKECQAEVGEDIFDALLDSGDLVLVSPEVVFRKEEYEIMVEGICQVIRHAGQITLAEVRDLFRTSRRYAQALLEYVDSIGTTVRDGDVRRLKT